MERNVIRTLLIEDDPVDALRVRRALEGDATGWPSFRLERASALQTGIHRLAQAQDDVVLLDLGLPDSQGVETLQRLRSHDPHTPVVVLTGTDDEETAIAALAGGAQDYLVKECLAGSSLRRSVLYALERGRVAGERQAHERRLLRAEKEESLGALSAGIGFGFNELLGTILARCHVALASLDVGERAGLRDHLLEIHRSAFRASEMAARLRDYAGSGRRPERLDLSEFVLDASPVLATLVPSGVEISYELEASPLEVEIGKEQLFRILVELIRNAAEAIGGRPGSVEISTGWKELAESDRSSTHGYPYPRPGRYAFLRLVDSGRGLAAAREERLFDPFYTTKFAGRGLGLAGVVGILRECRGVVRVDPVDARRASGAVFTILLPDASVLLPH